MRVVIWWSEGNGTEPNTKKGELIWNCVCFNCASAFRYMRTLNALYIYRPFSSTHTHTPPTHPRTNTRSSYCIYITCTPLYTTTTIVFPPRIIASATFVYIWSVFSSLHICHSFCVLPVEKSYPSPLPLLNRTFYIECVASVYVHCIAHDGRYLRLFDVSMALVVGFRFNIDVVSLQFCRRPILYYTLFLLLGIMYVVRRTTTTAAAPPSAHSTLCRWTGMRIARANGTPVEVATYTHTRVHATDQYIQKLSCKRTNMNKISRRNVGFI